MRVVEAFTDSRTGDPATNEDIVVATDAYLAIFDGATDKSGCRYEGLRGGSPRSPWPRP